jgi:hypothetical protein
MLVVYGALQQHKQQSRVEWDTVSRELQKFRIHRDALTCETMFDTLKETLQQSKTGQLASVCWDMLATILEKIEI